MNSIYLNRNLADRNVMSYICDDIFYQSLEIITKRADNQFCGVFVEGRNREVNSIEDFCAIKSLLLFLEKKINIYCFLHNSTNFLKDYTHLTQNWPITIIPIHQLNDLFAYSDFCKRALYLTIPHEHEFAITIQPDAMLYKNGLEKFILDNKIDIIGAHYKHTAHIMRQNRRGNWSRIFDSETRIGNGGMSVRNIRKMLKISLLFGDEVLAEGNNPDFKPPLEDLFFFGLGFAAETCKVPTLDQCCQFARDPIDLWGYKNKASYGFHCPVSQNPYLCDGISH